MKKNQSKTVKKLPLDKFKVAEFKNLRSIKGGNADSDENETITPPTNSGQGIN